MNRRMNRGRLNIGAYFLQPYAQTREHVKDVKNCGIDFITCLDHNRALLDLFAEYDLGAVVSGVLPAWWGGNGDNGGSMAETNPLCAYEAAADAFEDHPAIWGVETGDEPSALDFPHYGRIIDFVNHRFVNQFPYLNLYPNYASVAANTSEQTVNQLGTATYEEHIAQYVKHVPTDYICYDFYVYSLVDADRTLGVAVEKAFDNLWTVSDACRDTGRSMWIVLQVNSDDFNVKTSLNRLRFQAYTAMAFGAESIIWACYTKGWWHHNVLDESGNKTEQYEKLCFMNRELHNLGDAYMRFRRTSTHFIGFPAHMRSACKVYSDGFIKELRAENGTPLICGAMIGRNSVDRAYLLCACDDPGDEHPCVNPVSFQTNGRTAILHRADGSREVLRPDNEVCRFELMSNQGVLLEVCE